MENVVSVKLVRSYLQASGYFVSLGKENKNVDVEFLSGLSLDLFYLTYLVRIQKIQKTAIFPVTVMQA